MVLRLTKKQYEQLRRGDSTVPARTKYGSTHATADNLRFQSRFEARRYQELKLRQKAGEIRHLQTQVAYELAINGILICVYLADFVYDERVGSVDTLFGDRPVWAEVVEDTKSDATRKNRAYRIKTKLMRAIHQIEIREVVSQSRSRHIRRKRVG